VRSGNSRFEPAVLHHILLLMTLSGSLWFAWTGFIASDDEYYAEAGMGWLHDFPYVATHFGTVRAAVGIPIAIMLGFFGEHEFTVVLSTCLFFAATASLTLVMLTRLIGAVPALVSSCVMATVPLFALKSTIASADVPELFFVASSFWLFLIACQRERKILLLLAAGVCAGLAFSAHEITVALLLYYGVLFLVGQGIPRREYWIMAIGFLAVIAVECLYYGVMTGNPLHRFALLLGGAVLGDRTEVGVGQVAGGGTLHIWGPVDPLVMLFLKHEFGLLGLAAVPGLWWAFVARRSDGSQALTAARRFAGLGFVWFLVAAIVLRNMTLLPRYYMVTAYCLFIVIALWACVGLWPERRRFVLTASALFFITNVLAIYVDNKNPRFGERSLVEYLGASSGAVYTDPLTAEDTDWFCRWAKADCARIIAGAPSAGQVYFYNPRNADRPTRFVSLDRVPLYRPRDQWQEIWRKEEPRKASAIVIERLGLASWAPHALFSKLDRPNPTVRVYHVTE
jgi:4-amino-4-deoxy-L-arabinose transferase-like glycosyltransferase